jgi:ParB family chromosome partitioning protein
MEGQGLRGRLPPERVQDVIGAVRESASSNGRTVELEFHQLDLRYERLRVRHPARERRLLASLADAGQQTPIVVVATAATHVVVDGHTRVRCLRRLHRDTVTAVAWEMPEPEALIFRQVLHTDATDSALEQGWLLRTLHEDHGLPLEHLARRFDRSVSWVSRRLSLVRTLPAPIQEHVRDGQLVAHAAMKYFVPLARANAADSVRLVTAITPHRLSTRQIGRLYQVYVTGPDATRELVLTDPLLVLRVADDTAAASVCPEASAPEAFLSDLHIVGAVARRAHRRLHHGGGLLPPERARMWRVFEQVQTDFHDLQRRCEQELRDARSGTADGDFELTGQGPRDPPDRPSLADLPWSGPDGAQNGQSDRAPD